MKVQCVGVLVGGRRVNEGEAGEEYSLMDFIYIHGMEQWNLLQLV
jgi:hypothetical protein